MLNRATNEVSMTQQQRGQSPSHQYQNGAEAMNRGFLQALHREPVQAAKILRPAKDSLDAGTLGVDRIGE